MADSQPLSEGIDEDDPMLALGELIEQRAIVEAEFGIVYETSHSVPDYQYTPMGVRCFGGIHPAQPSGDPVSYSQFSTRRDARLAAKLVAAKVAAERERCAGVAEARVCGKGHRIDDETEAHNLACECIAATIRAGK